MKLFSRYVLKLFIKSFLLIQTFMAVLTVLINSIQHVKLIGEFNTTMWHVLYYDLLLAPSMLYLYMPISVILTVLSVMIILMRNNELLAFVTHGGRIRDIAYPLGIFGVVLAMFLILMANYINPMTMVLRETFSTENMQRNTLKVKKLIDVWLKDSQDNLVHIDYIDPENRKLVKITEYKLDKNFEISSLRTIDSASFISGKDWMLKNVMEFVVEPTPRITERYDEKKILSKFYTDIIKLPVLKPIFQTSKDLERVVRIMKAQNLNTTNYELLLIKNYAHSVSVIVMIMLVFPIAVNFSRHTSYIVAASKALGAGMVYWVTTSSLYSMGKTGVFSPIVANFLPHLIFAVIAFILIKRSENPA